MPRDARKPAEIAARRRKVAGLYLRRATQQEIAEKLGVSLGTVNGDIQALLREWRQQRTEHIDDMVSREMAALEEMDRDCAAQFAASKDAVWVDRRLKIADRMAKLLGLDAPQRMEMTGKNGGPIETLDLTPEERAKRVSELLVAGENRAGKNGAHAG